VRLDGKLGCLDGQLFPCLKNNSKTSQILAGRPEASSFRLEGGPFGRFYWLSNHQVISFFVFFPMTLISSQSDI